MLSKCGCGCTYVERTPVVGYLSSGSQAWHRSWSATRERKVPLISNSDGVGGEAWLVNSQDNLKAGFLAFNFDCTTHLFMAMSPCQRGARMKQIVELLMPECPAKEKLPAMYSLGNLSTEAGFPNFERRSRSLYSSLHDLLLTRFIFNAISQKTKLTASF